MYYDNSMGPLEEYNTHKLQLFSVFYLVLSMYVLLFDVAFLSDLIDAMDELQAKYSDYIIG